MIGFKVNVGYYEKNTFNVGEKIDVVTWTDMNRMFVFHDYPGTFSNTRYESNLLYDTLKNILGNGVNAMYTLPLDAYVNSTLDYYNLQIPSYRAMCPNLWNVYSRNWEKYLIIYFTTLDRVVILNGYDSARGSFKPRLYSVENGTIKSLLFSNSDVATGFFGIMNWGSGGSNFFSIPCIENSDNLLKANNYGRFSVGHSDDSTSYNTYSSLKYDNSSYGGISESFLKYLFQVKTTPDWDGSPMNPYEPGGESGEGGGGGNFDDNSDPIPDSSLPTLSSSNTGFTRIYNPTLLQVQDLARYLWTDTSVIETIWNHIKQFFENPMEAIIGFNLVPVPVPDGGIQNFALMYIDTGVSMTVAANQFVDVDCGTLDISKYYGSALDYSPYTKISCFLPFIGTVQLNTDEVMNTTLQVKYRVDICSGSCVAKILVNGNVLYQYSGHCAIPIPIAAADFSSYVSAAISVAKLAIGAAVGGGMGALMAGSVDPTQQTNQVVTRTTTTTETARNPATGRQITTGTRSTVETVERPQDSSSTQASFDGLTPTNVTNTVGQIMSSKPHVEHSGSFSGNTGYLGVRRPYVIIQRPNMCMPSQYQQFNGFPCMITLNLGECSGFTQVQQVQLTGVEATNPEQSEILQFLKSGVIL